MRPAVWRPPDGGAGHGHGRVRGRALRAALDSSPLSGAGRVEDTINLMGHALRKALGVIAVLQGRGQAEGIAGLAEQAGAPMPAASSLKAALDRDWDDPAARDAALAEVLGCLDAVEAFAAGELASTEARAARDCLKAARQVRDQDVDLTCPQTWSATAIATWRSSARRGGCATPPAATPRPSSPSTSPPGS